LTAKSLAALKTELVEERAAREKAQIEGETLTRAIEELKKMVDRLTTQVSPLEEKMKHLDNKVIGSLIELLAKELNLERTNKAKEYYKSQNTADTEIRK
jgi:hypothetical protein